MPGAELEPADPLSHRVDEPPGLGQLFHRLNNQLGIILAHAELIEAKSADAVHRSRAGHVVNGVMEALGIANEIRSRLTSLSSDTD